MHQVILALRQPGDQRAQDGLEEPFRVLSGEGIGRHGEDHARPHHRRPPRPEPSEHSRRRSPRTDFRDAWCGTRVAPGLPVHDYRFALSVFLCTFFRVKQHRRRKEESFRQKAQLQRMTMFATPKNRMQCSIFPHHPTGKVPSLHAIVRRFFRDDDVVDMALAQSCCCDANEAALLLQFPQRARTNIPHPAAQPSHELICQRTQ